MPTTGQEFFSQAGDRSWVVDLNRVEFAGVPGEHFVAGTALRIKISDPVLVMPAGGANV